MSFDKKTVYHSDFVGAGKIEVLIDSDVMKSKYPGKGTGFYVNFKYQGKPHQYIVENDRVQKKLHGLKGHVVEIEATGSREEADIEIFDAAGPASSKTQTHREEPRPPAVGAPATDDDVSPTLAAKRTMLQHINARILALEAARMLSEEWDARHPDLAIGEEHFMRIASNFYIALDRKGQIDILPYEMIQPKGATKATPREEPPPPKRTPPPPPLDDDPF